MSLGILAAAAIFAMVLFGLFLWRPWQTSSPAPSVAIAAADSSPVSQDYARNILAQLGELQSANPDALQLVGADARKRARLVFEVAGANHDRRVTANLVLLDVPSGTLIWSSAFERPLSEAGDLRQQLGYTAAQLLDCAVDVHRPDRPTLELATLKLYLNGCAELASGDFADVSELIRVFRQVIAAAPRFDGAWAKLLMVEDTAYVSGNAGMKESLRRDIAAARKANPDLAEAYLVEADLLPDNAYGEKIALVDRAIASAPGKAAPLTFRSQLYFAVGRVSDALDNAKRAAQLDPISPSVRTNYIFALAQADRTRAALDEIARAERVWPGSSAISNARFAIHFRFGDPRIAWQMIESGQTDSGWVGAKSFIDARMNPTRENVDRAIRDAEAAGSGHDVFVFQHLVQVMSILNRENELLGLLLTVPLAHAIYVTDVTFRPAARELWRNPKSLEYAKRVGLLQYWQSSGKWPDFCSEGDLSYDCKKAAAKLG